MKTFLASIIIFLFPFFIFAQEAPNSHSTDIEVGLAQSWSITDASQVGLDFTGNHSFCGWFKFESTPALGSNMILLTKINTSTERSYWVTARNQAGTLRFQVALSSNGSSTAWEGWYNYTFTTGTWYHICYTYSTSPAVVLYVNGVSQTLSGSTGTIPTSIFNSNADFFIGRFADFSSSEDYDGLVDSLVAYSSTLSSANITSLYTTACNPPSSNLVSWWRFNNNGNDSVGVNNLTNNNSATFSTDVPYACARSAGLWEFFDF